MTEIQTIEATLKELQDAVHELLHNNGGPTSTLDGTDTHVLVECADFDRLVEMEKQWLRQ